MREIIYRTTSLPTLSEKASAHFLRSLVMSGASIKAGFSVGVAETEKSAAKHSMHFLLYFPSQAAADRFESFGWSLSMPERIAPGLVHEPTTIRSEKK